jgi:hypothetical protein
MQTQRKINLPLLRLMEFLLEPGRDEGWDANKLNPLIPQNTPFDRA